MSSSKPIVRQTAEWLSLLQNEEKRNELLEQAVGEHQLIALDAQDLKQLLVCGSTVIIAEGAGHTCSEALDSALQSSKSSGLDIQQAKAVLVSVIIQNTATGTMEAIEAVEGFFEGFLSQTKMVWGVSINTKQNSEYLIRLWTVIA